MYDPFSVSYSPKSAFLNVYPDGSAEVIVDLKECTCYGPEAGYPHDPFCGFDCLGALGEDFLPTTMWDFTQL